MSMLTDLETTQVEKHTTGMTIIGEWDAVMKVYRMYVCIYIRMLLVLIEA